MFEMKLRLIILSAFFPILLMASCAVGETEPLTDSPRPPAEISEPTNTAKPTSFLLTDLEALVGTWFAPGYKGMYWQFNPDGSCRGAFEIDDLDGAPNVECFYHFEEGHLVQTTTRITGIQPYREDVAINDVLFADDGNICFKRVKDTYTPRIRTMVREHERVE